MDKHKFQMTRATPIIIITMPYMPRPKTIFPSFKDLINLDGCINVSQNVPQCWTITFWTSAQRRTEKEEKGELHGNFCPYKVEFESYIRLSDRRLIDGRLFSSLLQYFTSFTSLLPSILDTYVDGSGREKKNGASFSSVWEIKLWFLKKYYKAIIWIVRRAVVLVQNYRV